ncbi:MAG: hypothetical protein ABIL50_05880 [candidate division WOR-3 bacterium]
MLRLILTLLILVVNLFLSNFHIHKTVYEPQNCPAYVLNNYIPQTFEPPQPVFESFGEFFEVKNFKENYTFWHLNVPSVLNVRSPPHKV